MIELVALSLAAAIVVATDLVTTRLRRKARLSESQHRSVADTTPANDGAIPEGRNTPY